MQLKRERDELKPESIAERLGINAASIVQSEILSERHEHKIWRVHLDDRVYVLKGFPDPESALTEVSGYRLLQELKIPTIPVYGIDSQAILMEDLDSSSQWRLASQNDVAMEEIGCAIGEWYLNFHRKGSCFLSKTEQIPNFLTRESDCLNASNVFHLGELLEFSDFSVWQMAADNIELLKSAEASLNLTLNYNDFHWTNLALSRFPKKPIQALIFDYHLLGVGMPYSDYRNVMGALSDKAGEAFRLTYGTMDRREEIIDRPLSTLHALVIATRRKTFPKWANSSRDHVVNGDFERNLREAIELAETM